MGPSFLRASVSPVVRAHRDIPSFRTPLHTPGKPRERATGGVGLGLAVFKSSLEACRGTVASAATATPRSGELRLTKGKQTDRPVIADMPAASSANLMGR
jgi:hypothetical protein